MKSLYITKYKREWLEHLEVTKTGKVCFNSEVREKLIELFPDDKVLQSVYEPLNMKTAIQQITKLLTYADGDLLYPNYNFLGAATARFRVAKPELQNLVANENYNVRKLLLEGENVFTIGFSSQEDRMSASYTKEPASIKAFIEGGDVHQDTADNLGLERKQGKTLNHGIRYGMGQDKLKKNLGVSASRAEAILDSFKSKYPRTFEFIEQLSYKDEMNTPLLGRKIRFSKFKDYSKFN